MKALQLSDNGRFRWSVVGLVVATGLAFLFLSTERGTTAEKVADGDGEPVLKLSDKWVTLYRPRRRSGNGQLPEGSPLEVLTNFEVTGPRPGDPFQFGEFQSIGKWIEMRGALQTSGKNAVLKIARAEDFTLEGQFFGEGLGGWFLLIGWDNGHGYGLMNVTLKESGSPWLISEFRDSKSIENTYTELHRLDWKGVQPLRLSVSDKKLTLQVGRERIAESFELPNYHEGAIILGTYDTRYGPKQARIHSLRIRGK